MSNLPYAYGPYASRGTVSGTRGRHEDYLRIVRGTINTTTPTIVLGIGFTIAKNGTGDVSVTFSPAFSAAPSVVTITQDAVGFVNTCKIEGDPTASTVRVTRHTLVGAFSDGVFHFIAIGPV